MDHAEYLEMRRKAWNAAHEVHHPEALSGSIPHEVWEKHGVTSLVRPGAVVLDIGVGLGNMARALHEAGCIVDCLDIADKAEEAVRPWCRRFYTAANLKALPDSEYTLAISHLVAQHMPEQHLVSQVVEVFRALRPGGVFSLHLAGLDNLEENNLKGEIPPGFDGKMGRTPEYAVQLFRSVLPANAVVTETGRVQRFPEFGSYWYWVHISKKL